MLPLKSWLPAGPQIYSPKLGTPEDSAVHFPLPVCLFQPVWEDTPDSGQQCYFELHFVRVWELVVGATGSPVLNGDDTGSEAGMVGSPVHFESIGESVLAGMSGRSRSLDLWLQLHYLLLEKIQHTLKTDKNA